MRKDLMVETCVGLWQERVAHRRDVPPLLVEWVRQCSPCGPGPAGETLLDGARMLLRYRRRADRVMSGAITDAVKVGRYRRVSVRFERMR